MRPPTRHDRCWRHQHVELQPDPRERARLACVRLECPQCRHRRRELAHREGRALDGDVVDDPAYDARRADRRGCTEAGEVPGVETADEHHAAAYWQAWREELRAWLGGDAEAVDRSAGDW